MDANGEQGHDIIRDVTRSGTDAVADLILTWAAVCDLGLVRETNEDAALALPGRYLVADGMGGHESGEIASEIALRTLSAIPHSQDQTRTQSELIELLDLAQERIGEIDPESVRRAGTTVTGAVLVDFEGRPHWLVANIGDSRVYRYIDGDLEQVTVDHSQVQEFVDAGFLTPQQARTDPRRNVITRALGAGMAEPEADFFSFPAETDSMVLLCTDGLSGELPDEEIAEILSTATDPADAVASLVAGAHGLGAHDNVTAMVVSVTGAQAVDRAPVE